MPVSDRSATEYIRRRKAKALALGPRPILPTDQTNLQDTLFGQVAYTQLNADATPVTVCCGAPNGVGVGGGGSPPA